PQVSAVVGETMWTLALASGARSPKSQVRTPSSMSHASFAGSIVQSTPSTIGKLSVSPTPYASPSPLLVTVIVKPIWSPADTSASSAIFVTSMSEQLTVAVAVEELFSLAASDSLEDSTVAVFSKAPQVSNDVVART